MGSCFLKNFPQLLGLKREKGGVASARLFTRMNLRWGGSEEGDEFGEGCSELMGEGDLADRSGRELG
jgi:hypothetical protein